MPKTGAIMKVDSVWEEVYKAAFIESDHTTLANRVVQQKPRLTLGFMNCG
jgi:hypothetical protein